MQSIRKIKSLCYVVFSLLFLTILTACSDPEPIVEKQTLPVPVTEEKKVIALVMKTLTNPFFVEMEKGARRAEEQLGISLIVKTAAQETSIQQQIGIVEKLIRDKVGAIVIAPGDSVKLIPVLKQAKDAGIVVINIDNRLDEGFAKVSGLTGVPFISVDNEQAAYYSAQTLTQLMTVPTEVAILEGIREAKNADDRKNGALRAFDEHPLATVVAMETAHWKIDEAFEVTRSILEQYPNVKALFCANDMMALGAVQYLQKNNRTDVKVAGYDALDQAVDAVKDGAMVATVDQQAAEQGFQGVQFADRALKGESLPSVILVDTRTITAETLK